jgi:hypothetical protein
LFQTNADWRNVDKYIYLCGRFYRSYCEEDSSDDDDGRRVDFIAIEAYEAHCAAADRAATLDAAVAINKDYAAVGNYRYLEEAIEAYEAKCAAALDAAEAIKDYYRHLEETIEVDASDRATNLDATCI